MATKFLESGSAATQGFEFWLGGPFTGGTGAITSDAQSVAGSVRSIKIVTGASNGSAGIFITGIMADAGRRINMWMRFTGTPSPAINGSDFLTVANSSAGNIVFQLGLTSASKLILLSDSHANLATGTTVLSTSTDYRISIAYTVTSATVNTFTVYLNGVPEITVSNVTLDHVGGDELDFAWADNGHAAGSNLTVWGAHFYVDDGTSGDVGAGGLRVTAKRPFANGTSIQFTTQIGSGGSGYGSGHTPQVNERPLSQTNGWSLSNTTKSTEEYNIEGASVGDVSISGATIVDYEGWIFSNVNSTANTPVHHIIVNGVATSIVQSTTAQLFTQIAGSTTYPAGTGSDIGMDAQFASAHLTRLFEAGILVAYIPGAVGTTSHNLSLLGVGT